jgi:hypothetical protein
MDKKIFKPVSNSAKRSVFYILSLVDKSRLVPIGDEVLEVMSKLTATDVLFVCAELSNIASYSDISEKEANTINSILNMVDNYTRIPSAKLATIYEASDDLQVPLFSLVRFYKQNTIPDDAKTLFGDKNAIKPYELKHNRKIQDGTKLKTSYDVRKHSAVVDDEIEKAKSYYDDDPSFLKKAVKGTKLKTSYDVCAHSSKVEEEIEKAKSYYDRDDDFQYSDFLPKSCNVLDHIVQKMSKTVTADLPNIQSSEKTAKMVGGDDALNSFIKSVVTIADHIKSNGSPANDKSKESKNTGDDCEYDSTLFDVAGYHNAFREKAMKDMAEYLSTPDNGFEDDCWAGFPSKCE